MQKWLRVGLFSAVVILPLGLFIFITKRFFTRNSSKQQSILYNSVNNGAISNTSSSRISPQVIHNYTSSIVELTIDQASIGFIIGRGGEKIKRIQNEADVRIRFRDHVTGPPSHPKSPPVQSIDKIAVISGRPECTQLAKNMIEKMLQEKIRDEQAMEVRLMIPDWTCGRVIGQRGQNIKSMQKVSGAKITIENPPENVRRGEPRTCIIVGTPEQIRLANELVENVVQGETAARAQRYQNTRNQFRPHRNSSSEYLSSPTTKNQTARMHYGALHDLRRDTEPNKPHKLTLLSQEEQVYLVYFSQEVQSRLQPLLIGPDFFTAYVSTVNRSGCIWIQLLADNNLQNLIDTMTPYYSKLVSNAPKCPKEEIEKTEADVFQETEVRVEYKREDLSRETDSESDCSKGEKSELVYTPLCESDNNDSLPQSPIHLNGSENVITHEIPPNSPFKPGMLVAAPYSEDDKFYRGIICRIDMTDNEAHVYFVDFGDDEMCTLSLLHPLNPEFSTLPYQAVLCKLANVEIPSNGLSERAFSRLKELTYCAQWQRLCIIASNSTQSRSGATNSFPQCPMITIVDTNGPNDIRINSTLIHEHLVSREEYQHSFS